MCLRGGSCFLNSNVYVKGLTLGRNSPCCSMTSTPFLLPFPALIFCRVLFKKLMVPSLSHNLSCLIQSSRQPSVENPIIILQMKNPRKEKLSKVTWLKNDGTRAQIWAKSFLSFATPSQLSRFGGCTPSLQNPAK